MRQAVTSRRPLVKGEHRIFVDSDESEAAWRAKGYLPEGAVVEAAPVSSPAVTPKVPATPPTSRGKKG